MQDFLHIVFVLTAWFGEKFNSETGVSVATVALYIIVIVIIVKVGAKAWRGIPSLLRYCRERHTAANKVLKRYLSFA